MNKTKLLKLLKNSSELKEREDKTKYYVINKDLWDLIEDDLFKLGFEIDDHYYKWFAYALDSIKEYLEQNKDVNNLDNFEYYEFAEGSIDVYNFDLCQWLGSRNDRIFLLSEVLEETGTKDGFQLLQAAQAKEINEVYQMAVTCITNLLKGD